MNQNTISSLRQAMRKMLPYMAVAAAIFVPCVAHADDQYSYSRATSFVYSPTNGLLLSQKAEPATAALCTETTYTYDAYGNTSTVLAANCTGATGRALFASRKLSTTYAAQAATTSCTAAVGAVTLQAGAFPTASTNPQGHQESATFDPRFGAVTSTTGPNCLATKWQIDDFGRGVRETRADGTSSVTAYCYLPGTPARDVSSNSANCPTPASTEIPADAVSFVHSEPRNTADVKSGAFSRVYQDGAGRKIRTVTEAFDGSTQPGPANRLIVQDTDYNAQGAVVVTTQPYFLDSLASVSAGSTNSYGMTTSTYDALGRPTATYVSDPQGSTAGISFGERGTRQAAVSRFTYSGLTATMVNDKNQSQITEKNIDGQIFRKTDALGAQLAYQFDAFGNLVKTKDALQNTIAVSFDIRGRKMTLNDPDRGIQNYDYNAIGELVWQESPNQRAKGQSTTFAYDLLGRMTRRSEPEYVSTWTYDRYANGTACAGGIGKLCESATDNGVSRRAVYDAKGRPQQSSMRVTNGPTFTTAVSYDPIHGRVANMTYPTGLRVTYGYTPGLGNLESLSNGASTYWRAHSVNAWGQLEGQTVGNGVTTTGLFDPQTGRALEIGAGASNSVFHHKYTYDGLSNLKTREDSNGAGNGHAVTESYSYDEVNRLRQYTISGPDMGSPMTRTVDLQYNALGSLLYKSDVGNYTYPTAGAARPHAVLSIAGPAANAYQYDSNGNMTVASSGKYRNISYTSFDLPDSNMGIGSGDGTRYTWQYDTAHARIKEVRTNTQGTRTTWTMHPDNMGGLGFEQEINTAGAITNRNYLSAGGVPVGMVTTSGAITNPTNPQPTDTSASVVKVEYWHKDNLGSISAITNASGAVTQRMAYDPFGKRRDANGTYDAQGKLIIDNAQGTDRGFTGHEQMDDIGIVHMNGRIYDANIGRFMQADPIVGQPSNLQNFDRYSYVLNNPLNMVDPSGFTVQAVSSGCTASTDVGSTDCANGGNSGSGGNGGGGGVTTVTVTYGSNDIPQVVNVHHNRNATPAPAEATGCMATRTCFNDPPMGSGINNEIQRNDIGAGSGTPGAGTAVAAPSVSPPARSNAAIAGQILNDTGKLIIPGYAFAIDAGESFNNGNYWMGAGQTVAAGVEVGLAIFTVGISAEILAAGRVSRAAVNAIQACCCFPAGTPVATETGMIPIEDIQVGQLVYARDPETGETKLKPVTELMITPVKPLYKLVTKGVRGNREMMEVTDNHPYWVTNKGWVDAAQLLPGMVLESLDAGELVVVSLVKAGRSEITYNFTVADFHTYFAGSQKAFVHNCNACRIAAQTIKVPPMTRANVTAAEEARMRVALSHIDAGTVPTGPLSVNWGTQFKNLGNDLPGPQGKLLSPFLEYRVANAPNLTTAGPFRIVVNSHTGDVYFTTTHYGQSPGLPFVQVR